MIASKRVRCEVPRILAHFGLLTALSLPVARAQRVADFLIAADAGNGQSLLCHHRGSATGSASWGRHAVSGCLRGRVSRIAQDPRSGMIYTLAERIGAQGAMESVVYEFISPTLEGPFYQSLPPVERHVAPPNLRLIDLIFHRLPAVGGALLAVGIDTTSGCPFLQHINLTRGLPSIGPQFYSSSSAGLPRAVAADPRSGHLYLADSNGYLLRFSASLGWLSEAPLQVALIAEDMSFVQDSPAQQNPLALVGRDAQGNGVLCRSSTTGARMQTLRQAAGEQLVLLAADSLGDLYVCMRNSAGGEELLHLNRSTGVATSLGNRVLLAPGTTALAFISSAVIGKINVNSPGQGLGQVDHSGLLYLGGPAVTLSINPARSTFAEALLLSDGFRMSPQYSGGAGGNVHIDLLSPAFAAIPLGTSSARVQLPAALQELNGQALFAQWVALTSPMTALESSCVVSLTIGNRAIE